MYDPGPPPGGPPRLGRERSDADTTRRASFLLRPGDTESSVEARLRQAITKKSATSQQTQRPDGYPCDVVIHWGPAGNADERGDHAADDAEQQRYGAPHDAEPQARADDSLDGGDSQATPHLMSPVTTTRDDDAVPNGESDAATGDA